MKVKAVLGLISLMDVEVKQHLNDLCSSVRAQELSESRGERPGLPVPDKPDGSCGRTATFKRKTNVALRKQAPKQILQSMKLFL